MVPWKQEPEDNTVADEQEWYQDGWNEVGRTLHARREVNARAIAFVEGMEQICGAEKVEGPDQDDSQFVPQRRDRQQGKDRSRKITVCSRTRVGCRQIRRDDSRHQERQANEPKTVQEEYGSQGVGSSRASGAVLDGCFSPSLFTLGSRFAVIHHH